MKRLFILHMSIILVLGLLLPAYADVDFDPSKYTVEELKEIRDLLYQWIPRSPEKECVYNENGIYIEARGIKTERTWGDMPVIWFYVENNSDQDICVKLADEADPYGYYAYINRCKVEISNVVSEVPKSVIYMSGTSDELAFMFESESLQDYEITEITSLKYDLRLYACRNTRDISEDNLITVVPVDLTLSLPVSW